MKAKGSVSQLTITPTTAADLGTFTCWAENDIGKGDPCIFSLLQSDPKQKAKQLLPSNLTQYNQQVGIIDFSKFIDFVYSMPGRNLQRTHRRNKNKGQYPKFGSLK